MKRVWLILFAQFLGPERHMKTDVRAFECEGCRDAAFEDARRIGAYGVTVSKSDAEVEA